MLAQFKGGAEIGNDYAAALQEPTVDLVIIKGAVGNFAVHGLQALGAEQDPEEKTRQLKEILYNELDGLEAAEALITDWSQSVDLPPGFRVFSTRSSGRKEKWPNRRAL